MKAPYIDPRYTPTVVVWEGATAIFKITWDTPENAKIFIDEICGSGLIPNKDQEKK